jgi:hypothetical protein
LSVHPSLTLVTFIIPRFRHDLAHGNTSPISPGYTGEMVLLYTLARIINSTPSQNNVIYCIVLLLAIIYVNVPTGSNVVFISRCLVTDPNNVLTSNDQCQCRLQRERSSLPSFLSSFLTFQVKVTLRPTTSRPVRLGFEPRLGHMTRC